LQLHRYVAKEPQATKEVPNAAGRKCGGAAHE
jgi:hypothetical protein